MKPTFTSRTSAAKKIFRHLKKSVGGKCLPLLVGGFLSFQSLHAEDIYALSGGNLVTFKSENPGTIISTMPLTGIATGQVVEGLDFRPATGDLYALGYVASSGLAQVYTVNIKTGVATAVGTSVTLAANMVRVGMDFNPMADRIRVTSFSGQNYRLVPTTGALAFTDGNLSYAPGDVHAGINPRVEAVAYTNSVAGATSTTIYYYDYGFDDLANSSNPNGGVINTVGNAGIASISGAGLDLDIITNTLTGANTAFLSAKVSGTANNLYNVNLATGKASLLGTIGMPSGIDEMAVYIAPPTPKIIYALSSTGNLISFNSNNPSAILSSTALSGVASGQVIEGLDFRPATGELYALGYVASSGMGQVYTINITTAAVTAIGSPVMLATNMTNVAMDFNPMADRIRVTAAGGQNYRLVPTTGALAFTDGNLSYAPGDVREGSMPAVAAVAYSNSFAGTGSTTIYYYDLSANSLDSSGTPNTGVLKTVGNSGIIPANATGLDMDISSNPGISPNVAFLSANVSGTFSNLYMLNLSNGSTMLIDTIGANITVTDIAVYIAPPAPLKRVYAISGSNLIRFNSNTPGTIASTVALTGITSGQVVEGLDFRPATGGLYALGYNSSNGSTQIYTVDTTTGVVTSVAAPVTLASGMSRLSVDFNPQVDRLRVLSSTGQSYRLNPVDGTIAGTDTNLSFATGDVNAGKTPNINAAAYINNTAGTTTTALYYYDFNLDILAAILPPTSPNVGTLSTVGRTGIVTRSGDGLDLDIVTTAGVNTAFLSANVSGTANNFYTVNLATGEVRVLGTIGATISEFAVSNAPSTGNRTMLTTFNGKKSGNASELSWTTKNEVNNNYFTVERSSDNATFSAISGKIVSAAQVNDVKDLDYTYNDLKPASGINYYRLMQVDKDGKTTYSKAVQIQFNGGYEISTYPNPITSVINVNGFIAEKSDLQVKVTDIYGRMIDVTSLKNQSGNWSVKLNASSLRSGLYYVTVTKDKVVIHTETVQKN